MNETIITIHSFHPLNITWPDVPEFTGIVYIQFPKVTIDFQLGGLLGLIPGMTARSEGEAYRLVLNFGDAVMTVGQMMEFINKTKDDLEEMHQISQETLQKELGKIKLDL